MKRLFFLSVFVLVTSLTSVFGFTFQRSLYNSPQIPDSEDRQKLFTFFPATRFVYVNMYAYRGGNDTYECARCVVGSYNRQTGAQYYYNYLFAQQPHQSASYSGWVTMAPAGVGYRLEVELFCFSPYDYAYIYLYW